MKFVYIGGIIKNVKKQSTFKLCFDTKEHAQEMKEDITNYLIAKDFIVDISWGYYDKETRQ